MAFDADLADKYPFGQVKPGLDLAYVEPVTPLIISETNLSANTAYFTRFQVDAPLTVNTITIYVGSNNTGNVDAGIYETTGSNLKRITSAGATALGSTSDIQSLTLGRSVALAPGATYYVAVAVVSASATIGAAILVDDAIGGLQSRWLQKSSSMALPATITSPAASATAVWTMVRNV